MSKTILITLLLLFFANTITYAKSSDNKNKNYSGITVAELFQTKKKSKSSTVQCKAVSKSTKKRCKNMTSNSSGKCRVHGG